MDQKYKPGGGNKPQPFVPAGHGEESGQYTEKNAKAAFHVSNCFIKNVEQQCNFRKSRLVKKVVQYFVSGEGASIKRFGPPNSVNKKIVNGYVVSERFYDQNGDVYLDIDYTDHGNPSTHHVVPHIHRWVKDEHGKLKHQGWEEFK